MSPAFENPRFGAPRDLEPTKSLNSLIFEYISKLQQASLQLRMNHWQTESYAEHKATDGFIGELNDFIDSLGESTIGELGRPRINTQTLTVSDINITSTKWVIESIKTETQKIIEELRVSEFEGLLALLGDFDAVVKKTAYLITLG